MTATAGAVHRDPLCSALRTPLRRVHLLPGQARPSDPTLSLGQLMAFCSFRPPGQGLGWGPRLQEPRTPPLTGVPPRACLQKAPQHLVGPAPHRQGQRLSAPLLLAAGLLGINSAPSWHGRWECGHTCPGTGEAVVPTRGSTRWRPVAALVQRQARSVVHRRPRTSSLPGHRCGFSTERCPLLSGLLSTTLAQAAVQQGCCRMGTPAAPPLTGAPFPLHPGQGPQDSSETSR